MKKDRDPLKKHRNPSNKSFEKDRSLLKKPCDLGNPKAIDYCRNICRAGAKVVLKGCLRPLFLSKRLNVWS